MPDSPSRPPAKPYNGPKANEVEKKVFQFLPSLRMFFPNKPEVAAILNAEGSAAVLAKGYTRADIDAEIENEQFSRTLKNSSQQNVITNLNEYARATLAEGTFAEKWPAILETVAQYDYALATTAASNILADGFADAKALAGDKAALTAAQKGYFDRVIWHFAADLRMSQGAYEKRLREQPDYDEEAVKNALVNQLDQFFYFTQNTGTFKTDWPAKVEQVGKYVPDLAAKASAKFFERPKLMLIQGADGKQVPSLFVPSFENLTLAMDVAQKAAAHAGKYGYNVEAADAMVRVLNKLTNELALTTRPESEQAALRAIEKAAVPAYQGFMERGIKDMLTGIRRLGDKKADDTAPKFDLHRLLEQYFYFSLRKGDFEKSWPAKVDEISAFDPALGVDAAAIYFKNPHAELSATDFAQACAAAQKACTKASEAGNSIAASETMAIVLGQIRSELGKPRPEEETVALGNLAVSGLAARESFLTQGIKNAMSTEAGGSHKAKDDLASLLNSYLYHTIQAGTFARDWSAKMDEVTAFDPALASEAVTMFFRKPQFSLSVEDFAIVCAKARDAALKAGEQGHHAVAADTLANAVRQIRLTLLTPGFPPEKVSLLSGLEQSITDGIDPILPSGIKETIADLNIGEDEYARRRSENKNYSDAAGEARLMAMLDEYFYHTLRKGTLQSDWAAELKEVSSFDTDLAANAAGVFFRSPQKGLTTMAEFNSVCAAAEDAAEQAAEKGFHLSAAQTMADILMAIRSNLDDLELRKEEPQIKEVLSQLKDTGNAAAEKFGSIMAAWSSRALPQPSDRRTPEQIQVATDTLKNFVRSLDMSKLNFGGAAPTPGTPA